MEKVIELEDAKEFVEKEYPNAKIKLINDVFFIKDKYIIGRGNTENKCWERAMRNILVSRGQLVVNFKLTIHARTDTGKCKI